MKECLLKSNTKGYYTSIIDDDNVSNLAYYNNDQIILNWNIDNFEEKIYSLKENISSNYFKSNLDLKNYLINLYECFFFKEREFIKILNSFNENRRINYYYVSSFIKDLFKYNIINDDIKNELLFYNKKEYDEEKLLTSNINGNYLDVIKKSRKERLKIKRVLLKREDMC